MNMPALKNASKVATSYDKEWLQFERPQVMYDKQIHRTYKKIFFENPSDNLSLVDDFKLQFIDWLRQDTLNQIAGLDASFAVDVCIGCTHYIDDLYQTIGAERLMIFAGDYTYHRRLNANIVYTSIETLDSQKELLIAMPFPSIGDIHPQMALILDRCLELKIPVHIDAAWLTCSRDISFDFSHPAIASFAISLSKGLGLGANRIALRFSKNRKPGPITIMNDFNMNCQSLLHIGSAFMHEFEINYLWKKYEQAYFKICQDFSLKPSKAIHVAMGDSGLVGLRLLLRYLNDK